MRGKDNTRTAAEVLVDQLIVNGVGHAFCIPGESYLAVLDAFHDRSVTVTICRQEGGAAMMAEAVGKMTGRPGVAFVTRGPGATNASPGIHIAQQDSTPMILFVGQVAREMRGRDAFQELDYRAVFGSMTKWTTEIDDPQRIPEIISRRADGRDPSSSRCRKTCSPNASPLPMRLRPNRSRRGPARPRWRSCRR
jgi:acetolactate synthase-1/2/3 large subunit